MKLAAYCRDDGACCFYRITLPLRTLARNDKSFQHMEITPGDPAEKIENSFDADITVIPRVSEPNFIDIMNILQKKGKKFVIDHDDDMFNISPLSPHYVDNGCDEVWSVDEKGNKTPIWTDGKNIDLAKNRKKREFIMRSCEKADMITVTTKELAQVYEQYSDNVKVLPNCVDLKLWNKLPLERHDDIRLCWFGGFSHYEDWYQVSKPVVEVLKMRSQAKLVLMGHKWDALLKGVENQIEFHNWVPTSAYPYKAAILNPDIAVIPLRDTVFNRNKSAIKWIEMGALEVPSVSTCIPPYSAMERGNNGIFILENDSEAWVQGMLYLIDNPLERKIMGSEARKFVEEKFDINKQWILWQEVYTSLLN